MAIGTGHRSNNYSESKRNDHLDNNRRQEQRNKVSFNLNERLWMGGFQFICTRCGDSMVELILDLWNVSGDGTTQCRRYFWATNHVWGHVGQNTVHVMLIGRICGVDSVGFILANVIDLSGHFRASKTICLSEDVDDVGL
ncbi:hypothetical protein Tco_0699753 [Tanacetum coccineum]